MNIKKIILLAVVAVGAVSVAGVALASPKLNLFGPNWDIMGLNYLPNGGHNYPISHPDTVDGIRFDLKNPSDGYTNYMRTNYNVDMTGKTISAKIRTSKSAGASFVFHNYGGDTPASARIEFQSAEGGNSIANDYWWAHGTGGATLEAALSGITLTADTTKLSDWSNICGQSAEDTKVYSGPDCIGGVYPAISPHDGFLAALKNVKAVGFSFGGGYFYANGVGVTGGTGTFAVNGFSIQ